MHLHGGNTVTLRRRAFTVEMHGGGPACRQVYAPSNYCNVRLLRTPSLYLRAEQCLTRWIEGEMH